MDLVVPVHQSETFCCPNPLLAGFTVLELQAVRDPGSEVLSLVEVEQPHSNLTQQGVPPEFGGSLRPLVKAEQPFTVLYRMVELIALLPIDLLELFECGGGTSDFFPAFGL
jgi:hypothetical protein